MRQPATFLALSALAAGCDPGAPALEPSLEAEACEHMSEGPFHPVTATATPMPSSPLVSHEHTILEIALLDTDGDQDYEGTVRFEAESAGTFIFFLSQAVTLTITTVDAKPVTVSASTLAPPCPEIALTQTAALTVGTYYLRFEGAATGALSLLSEEER